MAGPGQHDDVELVRVSRAKSQLLVVLGGDASGDGTAPASDDWIALLPVLDPTVMGLKRRDFYIDPAIVPDLFDSVGNAGNTAWWRGRVVGTWVQDDEARVHVAIHPGVDVPAPVVRAFDEEAERLTEWFGGAVINTVWASPAMQAARIALAAS